MQCSRSGLVVSLSCLQVALGLLHLALNRRHPMRYGKHDDYKQKQEEQRPGREKAEGNDSSQKPPPPLPAEDRAHVPARCAWFLQELPACLVPALLLAWRNPPRLAPLGCKLLAGMFCAHYFYRTFIYSFLIRGRPFPLKVLFCGILFCTYNGFLQGYYMIYCTEYPDDWCNNLRFTSGLILFLLGLGINIHSDHVLRQLRKPGEFTYKIPQGGLFDYVSGANFFGEILEWFGYAIATWSLPAFTFAIFTLCCIGPRAVHHHRYYIKTFTSYPRSRKALIPFIF
uniref:3-oxo-5alpha-steroid 4-dehydrogenase (NADP(+)) n=1 Tax=Pogona vitticeps TaxID=103695 RepID=A0A6J0TC25_9SAUR|nr:3-oxo-5-alpha-steroid 4-dehydrogenase 2 [Pogona vitticeps]